MHALLIVFVGINILYIIHVVYCIMLLATLFLEKFVLIIVIFIIYSTCTIHAV